MGVVYSKWRNDDDYRFGYGTMEKDNEIKGIPAVPDVPQGIWNFR